MVVRLRRDARISNQYAAMPSLHIGWSTWCALAMWQLTRKRWARVLIVLYPVVTLFCIVVTANHYWIDAVGGLLALGVGYLIGRGLFGGTPPPDPAGRRAGRSSADNVGASDQR